MSSNGLQRNINITFQHFHCHCFASWSSVNAKGTSLYHFTIGAMTKNFAWGNKKWKWVIATERPQRKLKSWLLLQGQHNCRVSIIWEAFLDHPMWKKQCCYSTLLELALLPFVTLWLDNIMLEYLLFLPKEYELCEVCFAHGYLHITWNDA